MRLLVLLSILLLATFLLSSATDPSRAGEIGPDDFRISQAGGDALYDATGAAIAYNPTNQEYLAVWRGDDDSIPGLREDHFEVWGQRLLPNLSPAGARFRISTTGQDSQRELSVNGTAVAYNAAAEEYMVVWQALTGGGEWEIFGQRVEGGTGTLLGGNLRLTHHGADGDPSIEAMDPDIVYGSQQNEYLLVWAGDAKTIPFLDDEFEIFAQRLSTTGAPVGSAFRVSTTGPAHGMHYDAYGAAVDYSSLEDEYLVVWQADVVDSGVQFEIHGQRISAITGAEVGPDDFQISDPSSLGDDQDPAIAFNELGDEYVVVWSSDVDAAVGHEIYGQRVDASTGTLLGTNHFRISSMGPDPASGFPAQNPSACWSPEQQRTLVTWSGIDDSAVGFEIYGQLLDGTGAPIEPDDLRLSDMGVDGEPYETRLPRVAQRAGVFAVIWYGEDDSGGLIEGEFEIHGQLLDGANGAEILGDQQISRMGLYDPYVAYEGNVAYNPTADEFLVAWIADGVEHGLQPGEVGVFVRRVDAVSGALIDERDVRIDEGAFARDRPGVAYSPAANEFLVVWVSGSSPHGVRGQRLDADTLQQVGTSDFEVADPAFGSTQGARAADLAYCSASDRYLVVWQDERLSNGATEIYMNQVDASGDLVYAQSQRLTHWTIPGFPLSALRPAIAYDPARDEAVIAWVGSAIQTSAIYGDRIQVSTGASLGPTFAISSREPAGELYNLDPAIAFNSVDREYLVVWYGSMSGGSPALTQVFGQRLDATGTKVGPDDVPISTAQLEAKRPSVAFAPVEKEFLVTWEDWLAVEGFEVAARRIDRLGAPVDAEPFVLSDATPDDQVLSRTRVAFGAAERSFLVIWDGLDGLPPFEMQGREIRGQLFRSDSVTAAPLPVPMQPGPRLSFAFPNPFQERARFSLELSRARDVAVDVFDARGRRVAQLFDGRLDGPAVHPFTLHGRGLASGVYWIRATGDGFERARKVTLLR